MTQKKESEKDIEPYLKKQVEKVLRGWVIKFLPFNTKGLPDRIILIPKGIIIFAETKSTGDKPSPIQKVIHKKLRSLGFRVEIINNRIEIDHLIQEYSA